MPEGPEIHGFSQFVARHGGSTRVFTGVSFSAVSKHAPFVAPSAFTISSVARGKEMRVSLHPVAPAPVAHGGPGRTTKSSRKRSASAQQPAMPATDAPVHVLWRAGMTGSWHWVGLDSEVSKHAHVRFHAADGTLCYVDPRRFGSWHVVPTPDSWGADRGPDPVYEYEAFVANVARLQASKGKRPVCEVLLEQDVFNGIGNYLRAEILHRVGLAPFVSLADALKASPPDSSADLANNALLLACRDVPREVIERHSGKYMDYEPFRNWLQVYGKAEQVKDGKGRTIWFHPKHSSSSRNARPSSQTAAASKRGPKKSGRSKRNDEEQDDDAAEAEYRAEFEPANDVTPADKARKRTRRAASVAAAAGDDDDDDFQGRAPAALAATPARPSRLAKTRGLERTASSAVLSADGSEHLRFALPAK